MGNRKKPSHEGRKQRKRELENNEKSLGKRSSPQTNSAEQEKTIEVCKARSIPIKAPKDLIEAYHQIECKALQAILKQIQYTEKRKAKLVITNEFKKQLRKELLKNWKFTKNYVDSAMDMAYSIVRSWISNYNRGVFKNKPKVRRKVVYIKMSLFSYKDGILRISIKPYKRCIIIDLNKYPWIPKDFDKIGGLLLTENKLILTLKKKVTIKKPKGWASFDINLTNITAYINGEIKRYDLKPLYHIHRVYEIKRQRIQRLAKKKPKTARKLLQKYSKRELNRTNDFIHKLTTKIVRELVQKGYGAILEDLKDIKRHILNKSKSMNRKLSKWDARKIQKMLEYKLKWHGLPVKYVDPKNTSKTCPKCQNKLIELKERKVKCPKCNFTIDRDVIAALNLQMRGAWIPPRALEEAIASMKEKESTIIVDSKSRPVDA